MKHKTCYIARLKTWAIVPTLLMLAACGEAPSNEGDGANRDDSTGDAATTSIESTVIKPMAESEVEGIAFGDILYGDPAAPVEIIEYLSLSCGACQNFHLQVLPGIKDRLIDTGLVKFRFRNFVRDAADMAAAKISRCLGAERVYPFMDLFFRQQQTWLNEQYADELAGLARRAGMNRAAVDKCVTNPELDKYLVETRNKGVEEFDVSSTPTFVINGEVFVGVLPLEEFERIVKDKS